MIRLGITTELILQPILYGIENSKIQHPFTIKHQSSAQNCKDLLNGKLDMVFINPVDYARNSSKLTLVRDMAVLSSGASRYLLLFFRENLQEIKMIGNPFPHSQYSLLAEIIFSEFFELETSWATTQATGDIRQILENHPAYLAEGETAMEAFFNGENHLDLLEIWDSNTEAAYFHYLLATREGYTENDGISTLNLSRELGLRNLRKIAIQYAETHTNDWQFYFEIVNDLFQYKPSAENWADIQEFFQYLYFYGTIDYLPGLNFR